MAKKFRTLKELQDYVEDKVPDTIMDQKKLEYALKVAMRKQVHEVVYKAYIPQQYKRRLSRGVRGGLNDFAVMRITETMMEDKNFKIIFKNLAEGNDTLKGRYLADTIEEGIKHNWAEVGVWSEPRPFVQETIKNILDDPKPLIDAVKKAFIKVGFKIK